LMASGEGGAVWDGKERPQERSPNTTQSRHNRLRKKIKGRGGRK